MRTFLVGTLLLVFTGSFAVAQPHRNWKDNGRQGPMHEKMMKHLNLTEDQQGQMQKLQIGLMKEQTQHQSKVKTLRLEIKELFLADKVDRGAIEKNVKAITGLQEQMKLGMLNHWFAVNTILNAEQQKTWKKHASAMGQNMGEGMKHRARKMHREHRPDMD